VQRHAELLVRLEELGVDVSQALGAARLLGRCVIDDRLVVDRRVVDVGPGRLLHGEPVAEGLEAPFEQPLRLLLLGRNEPDDVFAQAGWNRLLFDVGDESRAVFAVRKVLNLKLLRSHSLLGNNGLPGSPNAV